MGCGGGKYKHYPASSQPCKYTGRKMSKNISEDCTITPNTIKTAICYQNIWPVASVRVSTVHCSVEQCPMSRDREVHNDDSITLPHHMDDMKWGLFINDVLMLLCYSANCGIINKSQSNVNVAMANGQLPLLSLSNNTSSFS